MNFGGTRKTFLCTPLFLATVVTLCGSYSCFAATAPKKNFHGRAELGSYIAHESFPATASDTTSNDFATISARFYLKHYDLGVDGLTVVTDVRNKYDFFDELNEESLKLDGKNVLQFREMSASFERQNMKPFYKAGRFPIQEAGGARADGAEVGIKLADKWRVAGFGGLNPRSFDKQDLGFNSNQSTYGAWASYEPNLSNWRKYFRGSTAFVTEKYDSDTDRQYWYSQIVYQWNAPNQLVAQTYLDFVPKTKIQNTYLSYIQKWNDSADTNLSFSRIDVIEYARIQGVRENLTPSPYTEGALRFKYDLGNTYSVISKLSIGKRSIDNKSKDEFSFGTAATRFLTRYLSGKFLLGWRKNFTSNDFFTRGELGFYSKRWEVSLNLGYGAEKFIDEDALTLHPIEVGSDIAYFFSRKLYSVFSAQLIHDERVNILGGFFRLGYRFGTRSVAPLRDGAPPLESML